MIKKIMIASLAIPAISLLIFSCKKSSTSVSIDDMEVDPHVANYVASKTFNRVVETISKFGKPNLKEIQVDSLRLNSGQVFHYFTMKVEKDGKINATVDIVDLHDTKNLPYGDTYAMNLNDMQEFNIKTKSGTIRLYDLNYDCFNHSKFDIRNNSITNRVYERPNAAFLNRFADIKIQEKDKIVNNVTYPQVEVKAIPCDANGNGNLGFFECYSCFKSASEISGTFGDWWCDVPIAGWASCWSSMSAACAILSSVY